MNKLIAVLLCLISLFAHSQATNVQICQNLDDFITLSDSDIAGLQSELDEYYQTVFSSIPEVSKGFEGLPDNWLKQSLLVRSAECYMRGISVKRDTSKAKGLLLIAQNLGSRQAAGMLANLRLFESSDPNERKLGFDYYENEYNAGSAWAAGQLGWAYQHGFGVEADLQRALELYHYAAERGMTYWQFLLAHAYEKGYLGLKADAKKYEYWLDFEPKVHVDKYECWIANYYANGTFPKNEAEYVNYRLACDKDNK